MHSHNRTLLARLGFSDPDKKDSRHDLAIEYLSQSENLRRMIDIVRPAEQTFYFSGYDEESRGTTRSAIQSVGTPVLEHAISKGDGQYKTTVGFLDLIVPYKAKVSHEGEHRTRKGPGAEWTGWRLLDEPSRTSDLCLVVECKIVPVGIGEILRQINLYREFVRLSVINHGIDAWVVATAYPLQKNEVEQLDNAKIRHVRLGDKFDQYVINRKQKSSPAAESPEV